MKRLLGILLILSACDSAPAPEASLAPALGKADGQDAADHDCRIVLDAVARTGTSTSGGRSWFVWEGDLRVTGEGVPHVLYGAGGQWWNVVATAAADGRFHFRIDQNTIEAGVSATALGRFRMELVPYLAVGAGRLFDHNRRPGDFESYVLDSAGGWAIAADPAACPERTAAVRFTGAGGPEQQGAVVSGGQLRVDYDLGRLTACRGTHNGFPAWDVRGSVRFQPGGQLSEASLRAFRSDAGTPTTMFDPVPMLVRVPAGATSAELWFHNSGIGCDAWDSAYGANYHLYVVPAPAQPTWAGDLGSSFTRACSRADGVPDVTVDEYMMERSCMFVEGDVYVPGLTDGLGLHPGYLSAQVVYRIDAGDEQTAPLSFQARVGNNYRFRWDLPREDFRRQPWSTYRYHLRFSTDDRQWLVGGDEHTVTRAFP